MTPSPHNTPATQAATPLLAMLGKYKVHIEDVLPKHITPQKFMKTIVTAINKTPQLLQCTPMSVINAVLTASQMGLEIGPGQSYLVPYGKECTLIIDYRGKIDLAIRSGKVLDIELEVVYSKEKFRIYRGENGLKQIEHEPMLYREGENGEHFPITDKDRGVPIGAYAMAILREGPPKIVFMPALDIDKIRNRAKARDNGPWTTDAMEMWKKTVCHRICKTLPHSAELQMAQDVDNRVDLEQGALQIVEPDPEDEVPMISAGDGSINAALATQSTTEALSGKIAEQRTRKAKSEPAAEPEPPILAQGAEPVVPVVAPVAKPPATLPGTQRPPMPSTAKNEWPKRTRDTFHAALGDLQYIAVLQATIKSSDDGMVNAANHSTVWAMMETFAKAKEIMDKQQAAQDRTPADIAAEVGKDSGDGFRLL